ncbi:MAG TPA: glycosyltransferase [Clostridia bacterium]|nr:glycosyltransferase [Clostridia bacterium]
MITILCSGSRGDFQPYIALAQALKQRGLAVRLVGGKSFQSFVEGYGIDFYPLSVDYLSADLDPRMLRQAQSADNPLKMLLAFSKMKNLGLHLAGEMYDACAGSKLVVYHPGCAVGYFAAEQMQIPSVLAAPFPMHRTQEVASLITYGRMRIPNALSYKLLQGMLWMAASRSAESALRQRLGKLPEHFGNPFERVDEHHPAVISCSNFVFPRPHDWNEHIHQHGYWFTQELESFAPPEELLRFLQVGEKPVYFGFGSMFHEDEKNPLITIISEALARTNKCGIISGMGAMENLPPNLIAVSSIPHTWLFRQVAAVCHHGGAGTTAAGFQAGVPSIIMPFSNDQFAWAQRAFDLGVGTKPLNRKKLTAQLLADALIAADAESIKRRASELAKQIATENGADECARVIADLVQHP